jgi:hypothetical protein
MVAAAMVAAAGVATVLTLVGATRTAVATATAMAIVTVAMVAAENAATPTATMMTDGNS